MEECIEPGSVVHTDGWPGYSGLKKEGYVHQVTVVSRQEQSASELMPRVHRVMSLLKRWLLGTHQGAVSHKHLDYYLDEFTFRFNRRKSKSRGKLFYRLVQQAVAVDPATYKMIVHPVTEPKKIPKPQDIGLPESTGYPSRRNRIEAPPGRVGPALAPPSSGGHSYRPSVSNRCDQHRLYPRHRVAWRRPRSNSDHCAGVGTNDA